MRLLLPSLGDLSSLLPDMISLPGPMLNGKSFGEAFCVWAKRHQVDYPDPLTIPGLGARLVPEGLIVQLPAFIE
jgi:hypothetical protein